MADLTTLGVLSARNPTGTIVGREEVAAGATTAILKFTPPTNCTTQVKVYAAARDLTSGDAASYEYLATFKRTTGNVTQIGSTATSEWHENDAAWDLTIAASTTAVHVSAVGDAANATRWSYRVELLFSPDKANGDPGGVAL